MESLAVFENGLSMAVNRLKATGQLTREAEDAVSMVLSRNAKESPRADVVRAVSIAHRRVRRRYLMDKHGPVRGFFDFGTYIDWQAIVDWIVDNWETILRIILFIIPFII